MDPFWTSFHKTPAHVPLKQPDDTAEEDRILHELCKAFVDMEVPTETPVRELQTVSRELCLESPLTPTSRVEIPVNRVGDTFTNGGLAADGVVFIHVNLSRKCDTRESFENLIRPKFEESGLPWNPVYSESKVNVVFRVPRRDEKQIRQIFRTSSIRFENGIRVHAVTDTVNGLPPEPPKYEYGSWTTQQGHKKKH